MKDEGYRGKKRKILGRFTVVVALSLALLAVFIIFNSGLGWFSVVTKVSGSDANVRSRGESFELAVSGTQTSPYADDSAIVTYLASDAGGNFIKQPSTGTGVGSILCRLVNENPHEEVGEELGPGSFGKISFDIVVKNGVEEDYRIVLDCQALGGSASAPQAVSDADLPVLKRLIKGHILFFETRSALLNGGYFYSDRIDESFVYDVSEHTYTETSDGKRYTVEFYWIWPATFSQLALSSTNSKLHVHAVFNDEIQRGAMLEYISENDSEFFMNLAAGVDFDHASYEDYYFVELSEGYNRADQFIGDKAHYLTVVSEVLPVEQP